MSFLRCVKWLQREHGARICVWVRCDGFRTKSTKVVWRTDYELVRHDKWELAELLLLLFFARNRNSDSDWRNVTYEKRAGTSCRFVAWVPSTPSSSTSRRRYTHGIGSPPLSSTSYQSLPRRFGPFERPLRVRFWHVARKTRVQCHCHRLHATSWQKRDDHRACQFVPWLPSECFEHSCFRKIVWLCRILYSQQCYYSDSLGRVRANLVVALIFIVNRIITVLKDIRRESSICLK